jgi:cysteinyl-tRNA synthetase
VSSVSLVRECIPELHPAGSTFDLKELGDVQIPTPLEKNIPPNIWDMVCNAPPLQEVPSQEVIALAEKRLRARTNKQWDESDQLRTEIASMGWMVQDSKDGYKLVKF